MECGDSSPLWISWFFLRRCCGALTENPNHPKRRRVAALHNPNTDATQASRLSDGTLPASTSKLGLNQPVPNVLQASGIGQRQCTQSLKQESQFEAVESREPNCGGEPQPGGLPVLKRNIRRRSWCCRSDGGDDRVRSIDPQHQDRTFLRRGPIGVGNVGHPQLTGFGSHRTTLRRRASNCRESRCDRERTRRCRRQVVR